ncbi:unnamed protein product [Mycena citricolor]|uniref:60S acidic ribosomal protein P1 n=1 Tax=Mycena citricolor TaxID=2018698 RepID=A0AAD2HPT3_9AGAR|nr:unnamed protein product [Mycena citricolor]
MYTTVQNQGETYLARPRTPAIIIPSLDHIMHHSRTLSHGTVYSQPHLSEISSGNSETHRRPTSLAMSTELAASYAALILADEGIEITADKIVTLTTAAKIELEPIWATLLAKALEGKNVKELLSNVGSGGGAPAASAPSGAAGGAAAAEEAPKEEAKEEEKEESDDDMGFGLFD